MVKEKEIKTKVKEIHITISLKAYDQLVYQKVKLDVESVPKAILNAIVLQQYLLDAVGDGHKIIIRDESSNREKMLLSLRMKRWKKYIFKSGRKH